MKERVLEGKESVGDTGHVQRGVVREEHAEQQGRKLEREKLSDPKNPHYLTALCQELWGSQAGE